MQKRNILWNHKVSLIFCPFHNRLVEISNLQITGYICISVYVLTIILKMTIFKANGLSFHYLDIIFRTLKSGIQLISWKTTIARSFIQHIISPLRSVHHPGNNYPITHGSFLPRWPILSIQDTLCILLVPYFIKEW